MIVERFYTYDEVGEDLVIYTWEFQERNQDGLLVYYNEQSDIKTECVGCETAIDFAVENEVFLSRLDVILEFENLSEFASLEFDGYDEVIDAEFEDDVHLSIVVKKDE